MNKNERKSQSSVGLFKIEAHLKYLQDLERSYLCLISSYLMVGYLPEGH